MSTALLAALNTTAWPSHFLVATTSRNGTVTSSLTTMSLSHFLPWMMSHTWPFREQRANSNHRGSHRWASSTPLETIMVFNCRGKVLRAGDWSKPHRVSRVWRWDGWVEREEPILGWMPRSLVKIAPANCDHVHKVSAMTNCWLTCMI